MSRLCLLSVTQAIWAKFLVPESPRQIAGTADIVFSVKVIGMLSFFGPKSSLVDDAGRMQVARMKCLGVLFLVAI